MKWPCIIKHADDDELVYVEDLSVWEGDDELQSFDYDEGDFMIDSSGAIYSMNRGQGLSISLVSGNSDMELVAVLGLVKAHAASKGSCCVAKLYAPTILDAFMIVKSMEDA